MTGAIRIGVDGRELRAGVRTGIGRYVTGVLRAASESGCECVVYGDRRLSLGAGLPGVTVRVIPGRWRQWWDQVTLRRHLARDRVSVFLSPYYKAPLFAPCPVVLTIHDLFFIGYMGRRRVVYDAVLRRLARLYAGRADLVITDSEYSKRAIVGRLGVDPRKIRVIHVGVAAEFGPTPLTGATRQRYGIVPPYVLYVGNFKPHKNLHRLLRAYAGLPASLRTRTQLVLAGDDPAYRPPLEELAAALGVGDRVRFPGHVPDIDLPGLYAGCAVFVLPSLDEGFGLPALEAMACRAPVVASHRGAIPEVVGDAALLVDPEDEAALATAIVTVLSDPDLRERLRAAGHARARAFSPDRTAHRVLAALRDVSRAA